MEGIAARENALVAEKNAQPVDEGERAEKQWQVKRFDGCGRRGNCLLASINVGTWQTRTVMEGLRPPRPVRRLQQRNKAASHCAAAPQCMANEGHRIRRKPCVGMHKQVRCRWRRRVSVADARRRPLWMVPCSSQHMSGCFRAGIHLDSLEKQAMNL